MSAPPSITIDHVQVAEIGKNTMTLSIEISGKNLGQKTIETTTLLDTGARGKFIDQNFVWNQKIKTKDWNIPSKFLMWMELQTNEEQLWNTPG